jgi:hypothetical protein
LYDVWRSTLPLAMEFMALPYQRQAVETVPLIKVCQEMQGLLLVNRLRGSGDVAMAIADWLVSRASARDQFLKRRREQSTGMWACRRD